ncbi:hypothetical protein [Glycomyces tarimensis]
MNVLNLSGAPTYTVDIADMADCDETATVSLGDAWACEIHRWELLAADEGMNLMLPLAGAGRKCGEHLRGPGTAVTT